MKYVVIAGIAYWAMCVFAYGHAYRQFKQEAADCVTRQQSSKHYEYCGEHMAREDAFFASLFWPLHWSEALWK